MEQFQTSELKETVSHVELKDVNSAVLVPDVSPRARRVLDPMAVNTEITAEVENKDDNKE